MVQAAHAAIESARRFPTTQVHPHLIVCGVKSEIQLLRELERLRSHNIKTYVFREPDIGGQATAIATEPIYGERRKAMSRYSLIRPPSGLDDRKL